MDRPEKTFLLSLVHPLEQCMALVKEVKVDAYNPDIIVMCNTYMNTLPRTLLYVKSLASSCFDVSANKMYENNFMFPLSAHEFYFDKDVKNLEECVKESIQLATDIQENNLKTRSQVEVDFLKNIILNFASVMNTCDKYISKMSSQPVTEMCMLMRKYASFQIIKLKGLLESALILTYRSPLLAEKAPNPQIMRPPEPRIFD